MRKVRRLPTRASLIDIDSPAIEVMRSLRLSLALRREQAETFDIVVTSAEPAAGKSTISANLALVAAVGGDRTLLIDADLAKPVQHSIFGLPRGPGLVECLAGEADISDVARTGPGQLAILTAGREISRAADVLSTGRMARLVERARQRFDVIVIDTPPVLITTDAAAIATQASIEVLFVVSRGTRRRDLSRGVRRLELVGAPIAGIAMNREGEYDLYAYAS
jgi:capsular exopolysaccharide synthesis family protein